MKRDIPFLLKPPLRAAIELVFYAPIWLTLAVYTLSQDLLIYWSILLIALYSIPQYVWHSGKEMKHGFRLFIILLLGLIPSSLLIFITDQSTWALLACAIVGIIFVERSFRSLAFGWQNSFSSLAMVFMLIGSIILQILKVMVLHKLADYNILFFFLGVIAAVLFLYIQNERIIRDQQMIDGASATIRRSVAINRFYITGVILLIAVLAFFREAQKRLEQWFKELYEKYIAWLLSRQEQPEAPIVENISPNQNMMGDFVSESEPSKFWLILEQVMKWTVTIVLVVGAVLLLYIVVTKLIPMFIKYIYRLLNQRALLQQKNEGYHDEIEGIMPQKSNSRENKRQAAKAITLKQWRKLSPIEKLKALYVHSLKAGLRQGKPITASNTAKQNLSLLIKDEPTSIVYGELLQQYNNMRYGSVEPDEDKLQRLREQLEQEQSKENK